MTTPSKPSLFARILKVARESSQEQQQIEQEQEEIRIKLLQLETKLQTRKQS